MRNKVFNVTKYFLYDKNIHIVYIYLELLTSSIIAYNNNGKNESPSIISDFSSTYSQESRSSPDGPIILGNIRDACTVLLTS